MLNTVVIPALLGLIFGLLVRLAWDNQKSAKPFSELGVVEFDDQTEYARGWDSGWEAHVRLVLSVAANEDSDPLPLTGAGLSAAKERVLRGKDSGPPELTSVGLTNIIPSVVPNNAPHEPPYSAIPEECMLEEPPVEGGVRLGDHESYTLIPDAAKIEPYIKNLSRDMVEGTIDSDKEMVD